MKTKGSHLQLAYSKNEVVEGLGLEKVDLPGQTAVAPPELGVRKRSGLPPGFRQRCKDGERTDHLTKLAGKLIRQELPLDIVKEICHAWNRNNLEPLPDEKIESTCESIWKTHMRNHPEDAADEIELAELPLFDAQEAQATRFSGKLPPKRRWLLDKRLPYGKVGAIVAPGGSGKSQFLLQLGASVAGGVPFLGIVDIPEPGAVLMLAAEDDEDELHRRLHNVVHRLSMAYPDDHELPKRIHGNLYVRSMVAEDNLMTRANRASKEVEPTAYVERLIRTTEQIPKLKLIIVDPASRFRGGDENTAQDTTRFIEALERLREATGATVLVAHHTNKWSTQGKEQTQHAARGSAAFTDGVRWQMNLLPLSKQAAKEVGVHEHARRNYVCAEIVKNNYGPPAEALLLRREEGGFLVAVALRTIGAESDETLLEAVLRLVAREAAEGIRHTRTSFENQFGGEHRPLKIGKVKLRAQLTSWLASGKLHVNAKKQLEPDRPMPSDSKPSSDKKAKKTKR